MDNMEIWNGHRTPPVTVLKTITGGRLKGMTDINPQWRYQALTEQFGPCGIGWKYEITRLWTEPGTNGEVLAFATINLCVKINDVWSDPIPGIGGSKLISKEREGTFNQDEVYKMATTDALSVACKMLGIAADIYAGLWDGTKYRDPPTAETKHPDKKSTAPQSEENQPAGKQSTGRLINQAEWNILNGLVTKYKIRGEKMKEYLTKMGVAKSSKLTTAQYSLLIKIIKENAAVIDPGVEEAIS